jgi:uncharacterized protein (TIGR02246 family)
MIMTASAMMEGVVTEDEHAIRELVRAWTDANEIGDVATMLTLVTDDVVFMVPGRDPLGRELLETAPPTSSVQVEGINEIVELQVLRDWAFTRNKVDATVTPPSGEAVHLSGCTLALFRQESDGRWRLARHANMLTTKTLEQGRLGGVV